MTMVRGNSVKIYCFLLSMDVVSVLCTLDLFCVNLVDC